MYAIVEIAGQHFKVEEGKKIFVHRMDVEDGKKIDRWIRVEDTCEPLDPKKNREYWIKIGFVPPEDAAPNVKYI